MHRLTSDVKTRRGFLRSVAVPAVWSSSLAAHRRPNVLLITADDLNYDSVGCYGCSIPNITPSIDRLAKSGLLFRHAHVTAAVCQPSRSVLMTGRYPHRNGAEGFGPIRRDVPTLQEQLSAAGYLNGILGKETHLAPREKFCWDTYVSMEELGQGRDPVLYYRYTKDFLRKAKSSRKPFFLMANSHDPHRPFAGSEQEAKRWGRHLPFKRQVKPDEVPCPAFLPELPDVVREVAQYFTSVHRCDEIVGSVLRALAEEDLDGNTLVMFLSDNGMAFPFSKTNCYLNSTRTPWIVRWPGRVSPGREDRQHMISGIDYLPTVLEAVGLEQVKGVDGRSFLPLCTGSEQAGRNFVVTVFHETSAKRRYEMRCIQTRQAGYIFNAWADGKTVFRNEAQSGLTFRAMEEAARGDAGIAARVKHMLYREPEEFYDFEQDPHALHNRIADRSRRAEIVSLKKRLAYWMEEKQDPLRNIFQRYVI